MTPLILAWSFAAPMALLTASAASQTDTVGAAPPTAIEQALSERACMSLPSAPLADADARQRCADAQVALLRTDFGRDLRRLSGAERTALDAACSRLETTHGRESYLDCVNAQLIALRARRGRTNTAAPLPAPPQDAGAAAASAATQASTAAADSAGAQPAAAATLAPIVGIVLLTIAAIAAGALFVLRKRGERRTCRQCGGAIPDSGDLCAACRHAAADALRRAASERMDQMRTEEAERRRKTQVESEQRRQQLAQEEDARRREQEEAQRRAENARREQETEARRKSALAVARASTPSARAGDDDEGFDPYAVLGVPRDTTPDEIRAAYEEARSKYDQESVAHLGVDVQEHFREKAQAVDRAYHMLAR